MKSGRDRADYFLDSSTRAFSMLFHILEYNDWEMKCARMELRGCHDSGEHHVLHLVVCLFTSWFFMVKERPGKRNSVNFIQELQEAQTIDKRGRGLVFIYSRFQAILKDVPKKRNLHK